MLLFALVLDDMKETGYSGAELGDWGFMPTQPDKLRQELQTRQLSLIAACVPIALGHEDMPSTTDRSNPPSVLVESNNQLYLENSNATILSDR